MQCWIIQLKESVKLNCGAGWTDALKEAVPLWVNGLSLMKMECLKTAAWRGAAGVSFVLAVRRKGN